MTASPTVLGVDFSGAAAAGDGIYVATAHPVAPADAGSGPDRPHLRVTDCTSMTTRVGTADRAPCLAALRDRLLEADVAGLDVSFGLPRAIVPEGLSTWRETIAWAIGLAEDATGFQTACRDRARERPGDGVDLKRATDLATGASSPYGLITYKQTFHGLRDVLAPLVGVDGIDARSASVVSVPPMFAGPTGTPRLCECYPAATLRRLDLPDERYKGDHDGAARRRERILAGLRAAGVTLRDAVADRARADDGGDALDAVLVAHAADRARRREFATDGSGHPLEGQIYT